MKTIIGIDPGLSGAIAVITPIAYTVHDMPTLEVVSNGKKRNRYNIPEIRRLLQRIWDDTRSNDNTAEVWLENVHAMPGQGVTSMFNMGVGFGILQAIPSCIGIPLNLISSVTWKKKIMDGQGKDKDAAVYKAMQLYPDAQLTTPRGRLIDGRAEALLIAHYGLKYSF